jgi:hypothetical protein
MEKKVTFSEDEISAFKKVFANLPEKIRNEDIILVVDKKPYTWNAVFFEISNSTSLGTKMFKKLKDLEII